MFAAGIWTISIFAADRDIPEIIKFSPEMQKAKQCLKSRCKSLRKNVLYAFASKNRAMTRRLSLRLTIAEEFKLPLE